MAKIPNPDNKITVLGYGCLTPLSTIFQLYHCSHILLAEESGIHGENQQPATSH
jgi:hypothetical protein